MCVTWRTTTDVFHLTYSESDKWIPETKLLVCLSQSMNECSSKWLKRSLEWEPNDQHTMNTGTPCAYLLFWIQMLSVNTAGIIVWSFIHVLFHVHYFATDIKKNLPLPRLSSLFGQFSSWSICYSLILKKKKKKVIPCMLSIPVSWFFAMLHEDSTSWNVHVTFKCNPPPPSWVYVYSDNDTKKVL